MKKLLSAILALILLFTGVCSCALADGITPRASDYFTSYGTSAAAIGSGVIAITFKAVGTDICNQIGVASYSVEKQNDEGEWVAVSGLLSGQTGTNVVSYAFGRYFQGVPGETYRIQVSFVCVINNGMETKTYTSGRVTAD